MKEISLAWPGQWSCSLPLTRHLTSWEGDVSARAKRQRAQQGLRQLRKNDKVRDIISGIKTRQGKREGVLAR